MLLTGTSTVRCLIDQRAATNPTKPFLYSPESNSEWTFADLRRQARTVARHLIRQGCGKGDKIAFLMENGLFTSGLLLGTMYGGLVPVPLNVRAGRAHLAYTLNHCDARVIFVSEDYLPLLEEVRTDVVRDLQVIRSDVDHGPRWEEDCLGEDSLPDVHPDDDALLMYTSGSTGQPKGAVLSQRQVIAAAGNSVLAHELGPDDCSLCVLPLYHINAVSVTLTPTLLTGGSVVMPHRFLVHQFWEWIAKYRCSWSALVPTIISQLLDWIDPHAEGMEEALQQIRFMRSSSAPLAPSLHQAFEAKFQLPLLEAMGSTECGGNIFSNPLPPGKDKIGTPGLPFGFEARIVAPDGGEVPAGQPGEILLRGPSIMTGYYKNPEATASILSSEGWLRTGDLAYADEDGYFFIVGRAKELIIKGGMNIAPRQIDDALSAHPGVLEAAALGVPDPLFGEDIVAFAVLRPGATTKEQDLLDHCVGQLGLFKTPRRIFLVGDLPKGPSGKVQRLRLADCFQDLLQSKRTFPEQGAAMNGVPRAVLGDEAQALRTSIEEIIAETWAAALAQDSVAVHDNFFGLGGHSLLAIEVLSLLRKRFLLDLSVNEFFTHPTVAQQALLIHEALFGQGDAVPSAGSPPLPTSRAALEEFLLQTRTIDADSGMIPPTDRSLSSPVSYAQERIWFLENLSPSLRAFYEADAVRLRGPLNVRFLQEALNAVVSRHESLRTLIQQEGNNLVQVIQENAQVDLRWIDLSAQPPAERTAALERLLVDEPRRAFNLPAEPGIHAALVRLESHDHVFILTLHHAVCDGWSQGVICRDLERSYQALCEGSLTNLPPQQIQYRDFAVWQRRQVVEGKFLKELNFWKEYLRGAPAALDLPTKGPRPEVFSYRGEKRTYSLGRALTDDLRRFSRQEEVSLFTVLTAAVNVLLGRYTNQDDIVLGIPLANRDRPELNSLVGFLIDFQALRTDLSGNPTFRELLQRVRNGMLEVNAHRAIPFNKVVEAIQPQRDPARAPVFQVMIVWKDRHVQFQFLDLPGIASSHVLAHPEACKYDLTLFLTDAGDELWVEVEYCTDLFSREMIGQLVEHFQTLLAGVVANPQDHLTNLPLLPPAERQKILVEWNDTWTEYPRDMCIHQLFETQAARNPEKTAVVCAAQTRTYAQLNHQAEQLALHLRTLGVGPDVLVALHVERSADMVVGLLGILKAGGAYLPLDPLHPPDRLAFMLEDARPQVLITQKGFLSALPAHAAHVVYLEDFAPQAAGALKQPANRMGPTGYGPQSSQSLAYVLYTSGSTGRPKGVQVPHRAVVNLLTSMRRQPGLAPEDVLLAVTTLAFDIAALELLLPLTTGACVHIADSETAADGSQLSRLLADSGATVMQATPSTWRMLIDAGWPGDEQLKILCGGEALSPDLAEQLLPRCSALWNLFGPTETTIWSTAWQVQAGQPISIGRPIANTHLFVLDRGFQPVPIGAPGELFIGGDGLARGYLNRVALSEERFVAHPFSTEPGARLYRTGDLVRYRPDGLLEFLGRLDHQVKVRGFRIELGEIEAVLGHHPAVRDRVVVAREDRPGDTRVAAYVVPRQTPGPDPSELRAYLEQKLPAYMVPSAFMLLDALPLTANGKVDRRALPLPNSNHPGLEYTAPRTPTEEKLAAIWAEALGVSRVGVHDDFFSRGGHSLLGVRMFVQIEKVFGRRLPLALLLREPTVAQLAVHLQQPEPAQRRTDLVAIQPHGRKPPLLVFPSLVGETVYAHRIAQHLDENQPMFGVQPSERVGDRQPIATLEEIAGRYAHDLCAMHPEGSFRLLGYSFGGILAFETARQLSSMGCQIKLLAVLDTGPSGHRNHGLGTVLRNSLAALRNTPAWLMDNLLQSRQRGFFATLHHHLRRLGARGRRILASGGRASWKPTLADLFDLDQLPENYQRMMEANLRALREYTPKPYQGRITLIRARTRPLLHSLEEDLGWGEWVAGGVDVRHVPGHHASILEEPHVRVLAEHLQTAVDLTE